jgi:hypothetical protein
MTLVAALMGFEKQDHRDASHGAGVGGRGIVNGEKRRAKKAYDANDGG